MKTRLLLILTLAALAVVLCGCIGQSAQRGGKAQARGASLQQSQNPSQPSTQQVDDEETTETELPSGSKIEKSATTYDENGKVKLQNQSTVTVPAPAKQILRKSSHTAQTIGASQKDTSRDLTVKYQAMRPVMYASILFFLAAAAFAYFGWWTKAGIMAGIGILMLILAAVIPGHEWIIIGGAAVLAIVAVLLVLYVYYKGHHDAATTLPASAGRLITGLEAKFTGAAPLAPAPATPDK